MKQFIKNISLFIIGLIIITLFVLFFYRYKSNNIHINKSKNVLIMGDSHTQSALNDSIIENSVNISQPSEHFLYSYNVLRLLLNNNRQIKKIVLGVSFHSFGIAYDGFVKDVDKTQFMFPKYYPILNNESLRDVSLIHFNDIKGIYDNIMKINFNSSINEFSFVGKYYKSNKSNLNDSSINKALQRHYYDSLGRQQKYSVLQLKYLKKIVALSSERNIQLILINTPIHKTYYNQIPVKFVDNYYSIIREIGNDKVRFIDLHSYKLEERCYGDGDHLNFYGAIEISSLVNKMIKNN